MFSLLISGPCTCSIFFKSWLTRSILCRDLANREPSIDNRGRILRNSRRWEQRRDARGESRLGSNEEHATEPVHMLSDDSGCAVQGEAVREHRQWLRVFSKVTLAVIMSSSAAGTRHPSGSDLDKSDRVTLCLRPAPVKNYEVATV
jgi:hypothetical protein